MDNYVEKITTLEKQSNENKIEQAKLKERLKTLKEDKDKLLAELKELGIEEEDLEDKINDLDKEIGEEIKKCEEILKW